MATQGRLAYEIASRPLFAESLHAVCIAVVIVIIARSGEFGAAWGPIDAEDFAVDAQGAQNFHLRLCADEVDAPFRTTRHDDVAGEPILHARDFRGKARRAPAARSVIVPQVLIPGKTSAAPKRYGRERDLSLYACMYTLYIYIHSDSNCTTGHPRCCPHACS